MAVDVAHAIANEFGTAKGGAVGDQKNEVRFGKWYAKNDKGAVWTRHIRPLDPAIAERAASMAEIIVRNQGIGYGQEGDLRLTLYEEGSKPSADLQTLRATCDCSSMILAIFAWLIPGFSHQGGTANMEYNFKKFPAQFAISADPALLNTDHYARRGDIYLRPGHVLIVLSNGVKATEYAQIVVPPMNTVIGKIIMDGIQKWCNVRSGPGTENAKIGIARVKEIFTCYGVEEEWYHIDFHGKDGWVFYEFASEMLKGNV